jgi:hypothetical protein
MSIAAAMQRVEFTRVIFVPPWFVVVIRVGNARIGHIDAEFIPTISTIFHAASRGVHDVCPGADI